MYFSIFTLAVRDEVLSEGVAIAVVGLLIVFTALLLISLFISTLPKLLERVSHVWPEGEERHKAPTSGADSESNEGAVMAAIGYVLHTEMRRQISQTSVETRPRD